MSIVYCFLVKESVITLFLNVVVKHTLSHTKLHRTATILYSYITRQVVLHICSCSLLELSNYCTRNRMISVPNARFPAQASGDSFYTPAATHARTHIFKLSQATNSKSHTLSYPASVIFMDCRGFTVFTHSKLTLFAQCVRLCWH